MELENVNPQRENLLNKVLSTYKVRQFILWSIDMCSVLLSLFIISKLTTIKIFMDVLNFFNRSSEYLSTKYFLQNSLYNILIVS